MSSASITVPVAEWKRHLCTPVGEPLRGEMDVVQLDCLGSSSGRAVVMLAVADAWWRHAALHFANSGARLIGAEKEARWGL